MEERQTKYTIGEGVELPSKGLIYDKKVNPYVELRSMTARDEMKRLSPSPAKFKVLADIIEGCMIEKPAVHVYDMALGDYEFLLHKLRIITYGEEYKIAVKCPNCGSVVETVAHLEELKVIPFDMTKFEELNTIKLPRKGDTIKLKFQSPRMLDEIDAEIKELKRKFKSAEISFDLLVLLKNVIDTVNGTKLSDSQLEAYVNNLPALDMTKLVNSIDELNALIGIENDLIVNCTSCGGEVPTYFRFGPEFFRPTNI
jgi:endogenous inhibitor of DNA gyrase (YacG/DUF329 family)